MAHNPLQPGEIGKIRTVQVRPGLWRADASFCDRSGAKRRDGLATSAGGRAEGTHGVREPRGLVTPTSLVNEAVDTYLANRMDDARNGIGRANPRSLKIYRSIAENWIFGVTSRCEAGPMNLTRTRHGAGSEARKPACPWDSTGRFDDRLSTVPNEAAWALAVAGQRRILGRSSREALVS